MYSKVALILIVLVLLWINVYQPLSNSAAAVSITPTPTASGFIPPAIAGPNEKLACPQTDVRGPGPVWHGVTIGESTFTEFVDAVGPGETQVQGSSPESTSIVYDPIAELCIQQGVVITIGAAASLRNLDDYLAIYGPPDAVTWTTQYQTRVIFWFDKGIAVTAWVGTATGEDVPLFVGAEFYFPYQDPDGFESRWPYNATWPDPPGIIGTGDIVPTQQNPYNFDAMIATITAEPSRTPTTLPPTATQVPFNIGVFPNELSCDGWQTANQGPTWLGLRIGSTTSSELQSVLGNLNSNYQQGDSLKRVLIFSLDDQWNPRGNLPSSITLCIVDDIVTALKIDFFSHNLHQSLFRFQDYIATYGNPDHIGLSSSYATGARVAYWYKHGIAVEFLMHGQEIYGDIFSLLYFPYQTMIQPTQTPQQ